MTIMQMIENVEDQSRGSAESMSSSESDSFDADFSPTNKLESAKRVSSGNRRQSINSFRSKRSTLRQTEGFNEPTTLLLVNDE